MRARSPKYLGPVAVGLFASLAIAPAIAGADDGGQSRDLELDTFQPVPRTQPSLLELQSPAVGETGDWGIGLFFHHAYEPLVVHRSSAEAGDGGNERDRPVVHRSVTLLSGALALGPFELGAALPFIQQSGTEPDFSGIDPANGPTLGNLRLRGQAELFEVEPLAVGWSAEVGLPTAREGTFAGAGSPSFRTEALLGVTEGRAEIVANAGASFRETRELADAEQGNELRYGLGVAYDVTSDVGIVGEFSGALGLDARSTEGVSPLEARAAVRYWPERRIGLVAGLGRGLMPGIGSPRLRGFALVTVSPGRAGAADDALPDPGGAPPEVADDSSSEEDSDEPGVPAVSPEDFECDDDAGAAEGCPEGEESLVVIAGNRLEAFQPVRFQDGSAEIDPRSFNLLAHVAEKLREDPSIAHFVIESHVHPGGDEEAERDLSRQRAERVKEWLAARGVAEERLDARGAGSDVPLVNEEGERARQMNERVEFLIEAPRE